MLFKKLVNIFFLDKFIYIEDLKTLSFDLLHFNIHKYFF